MTPGDAATHTISLEGSTLDEALDSLRLWVEPEPSDPSVVDVYYLSEISGEEWDRLFCKKRKELEQQTGVRVREVAALHAVTLSFEYEK